MGDNSTKIPVRLACGHWAYYPRIVYVPDEGAEVTCPRCFNPTHRPYAPHEQWHWKCTQEKCRTPGAYTGASGALAISSASEHTRRHPAHRVHVIAPNGIVAWRFGQDQDALPGTTEEDKPHSDLPG